MCAEDREGALVGDDDVILTPDGLSRIGLAAMWGVMASAKSTVDTKQERAAWRLLSEGTREMLVRDLTQGNPDDLGPGSGGRSLRLRDLRDRDRVDTDRRGRGTDRRVEGASGGTARGGSRSPARLRR